MNDKNYVHMIGTVDGDPTLKETPRSKLLMFRLSTLREGMKYPERTGIKAWGDAAVRLQQGDRVEVHGIIKTEKYGDPPKYWTGVVAEVIKIISDPNDDLPF